MYVHGEMRKMPNSTPAPEMPGKRRRDPEARRRAIVDAAAELLMEGDDLTHRRVADRANVPLGATTYYFASLDDLREAALELLASQIDDALAELRDQMDALGGDREALAALMHGYLGDRHQLGADLAIYSAALRRPELRPLAARGLDGMVEVLSAWTDPTSARLLAACFDGIALHSFFHDEPFDLGAVTRAVTDLMYPLADDDRRTTEENT